MFKRPLALMLGITGDLAFAAACLLLALRRHSPALNADVLLYTDGSLSPGDEGVLRSLGAKPLVFAPPEGAFRPESIRQFSYLSLARFEAFKLLDDYHAVAWVDVDTAIQDDIAPLFGYGPFAMAREDPQFTKTGVTSLAGINCVEPVPGFDPDEPNFNSGVLVLQDTLPDYQGLHRQCLDWLLEYGDRFHYIDQGVLNMMAQHLRRQNPGLVAEIPHELFNAHPRNPAAPYAAIVHAFGAYKMWDDGITRCSFPEWERDYRRWLALGGSPWRGELENANYLEGGAFFMLRRLLVAMGVAQEMLDKQQADLQKERGLRQKFEGALQRLSTN